MTSVVASADRYSVWVVGKGANIMIKHFCDKCQKEIVWKDELYQCEFKIKGYTRITDTFRVEYCKECLPTIIGNESFNKFCQFEEERNKRKEELKKQREV